MKTYLTTLIEEKGCRVTDTIEISGHIGLTYEMLIDFIVSMPDYHKTIRTTLVKIDFLNGNVFHYLHHLAEGMVASVTN
jgi:hypothetical protein